MWKVTNSLYELKMHSYTVHNGFISEGTLINYEKNDDEDVFIKRSNEYFILNALKVILLSLYSVKRS